MAIPEELSQAHEAANSRDFARAESLLKDLLSNNPDHLGALDLLGYVLFFQDRPVEAEAVCRRTLELEPEHPYALKGLGLCVAKLGDLDQAVRHLEHAIQRAPEWFDPYWDLCVVLVEGGRAADAVAVVKRARAALPGRETEWSQMERHARAAGARLR